MSTKTYHVRPSNGRHEGLVLITITLMLSACLALYVNERGRNEEAEVLYAWQVSAFRSLAGADQAIYNSLYTVKDEIPYIYESLNRWNEPGEKFVGRICRTFRTICYPRFCRTGAGNRTVHCSGHCTSRCRRVRCKAPRCTWEPTVRSQLRDRSCS